MLLFEKLRSSDIKLTKQRALIAEKMDTFDSPFSAEDLYLKGLKKLGIDLTTIYRSLSLFSEKGWISKTNLGDGHTRYVLRPTLHHLHTFVCNGCRKVEHLPGCFAQAQQKELERKGFKTLSHKVEFTGLCPECQGLEVNP